MKQYILSITLISSLFGQFLLQATPLIITSQEQFEKEILAAKKPCLIKFSAPGCPACSIVEQPFAELAQEFEAESIIFATVSAADTQDIFFAYNIRSIPTFLFFNAQGKHVDSLIGVPENFKETVREKLKTVVTQLITIQNSKTPETTTMTTADKENPVQEIPHKSTSILELLKELVKKLLGLIADAFGYITTGLKKLVHSF